ncbi:hypothetical protein CHS0354_033270 [Potamilus streckersoni]|uniref:Uncharacterized protein n=1 Tax=Potamilus streckersoni TaxID=2493646 RepID=A0AAE0S6A1_9BIVA|nr:hypothetical protein CHS0354_033270 [Potamilus streckersoni]
MAATTDVSKNRLMQNGRSPMHGIANDTCKLDGITDYDPDTIHKKHPILTSKYYPILSVSF